MNSPLFCHGFPFNAYPLFLAWEFMVRACWGVR